MAAPAAICLAMSPSSCRSAGCSYPPERWRGAQVRSRQARACAASAAGRFLPGVAWRRPARTRNRPAHRSAAPPVLRRHQRTRHPQISYGCQAQPGPPHLHSASKTNDPDDRPSEIPRSLQILDVPSAWLLVGCGVRSTAWAMLRCRRTGTGALRPSAACSTSTSAMTGCRRRCTTPTVT
jgi:hypothetical protein